MSKSNHSFSQSRFKFSQEVTIPKIIMQTWKNSEVPKKWKISPESIRQHMPDWHYVLMTDQDNRAFVQQHFPDFLKYYDAFPYAIQRADAIRYMWLYIKGGIYMDLDIRVMKPLDEFFLDDNELYLISSGNVGSCITNSFMAAKPGCQLWLKVLDQMKQQLPWYYLGKHVVVMNTTGPVMLNHVVVNSKFVYTMLPRKSLMPCSVCNSPCLAQDTHLLPLEGCSWIAFDSRLYNFFMCNWRKMITLLVIILVIVIILWLVRLIYHKYNN